MIDKTSGASIHDGDRSNSSRQVFWAAARETFLVKTSPDHDVVLVTPVGELDLMTAVQLESELRDLRKAGFRRFVLDLRELTFIDSTGVHLALTWDGYARSDGIDFELIEGSPSIQRIFEITGVKEQLSFR